MEITKEGYAVIEGDTHIGKWVKENKRLDFDQNATPLIMEFINHEDIVIDCGANIGAYSFAFRKMAKSVICFEPNPIAFDCLKHNLGKYENCFLLNIGVGSSEQVGEMINDVNYNHGASFIIPNKKGNIKISTIDRFNFPKVDFIKIDVEGFEVDVLHGATRVIERDKPKLYIEVNKGTLSRNGASKEDVFKFLDLYNYQYRNIYKKQPMEGEQYDIICW